MSINPWIISQTLKFNSKAGVLQKNIKCLLLHVKNARRYTLKRRFIYTGSKKVEMNGWNNFDNFKLIIEQDELLPLHITAVVMEQNINER